MLSGSPTGNCGQNAVEEKSCVRSGFRGILCLRTCKGRGPTQGFPIVHCSNCIVRCIRFTFGWLET
jgi:hypothetical protein